jgi:RNA polymerase sigma-70 factor, ECF subfamily
MLASICARRRRSFQKLGDFQCKPLVSQIGLTGRMERAVASEAAPVTVGSSGANDNFEELFEQYRPRIFRFILASLRNQESAENLTQDCFVRAYKARHQLHGPSSAGTWLMQIAANLVRSHEASGRLKFWRRTLRADVDLTDAGDWIPGQQMSPEELAAAQQQVEKIWKVAGRLSGKQRTVFLLRFGEDLDLLEIAAITGMKEGTVKTHLFRALKSVRSALEEPRK